MRITSTSKEGNVIIDHQAHFHPSALFDTLVQRAEYPRATRTEDGYVLHISPELSQPFRQPHLDLDLHVADMDRHGVGMSIISPVGIGEAINMNRRDAIECLDRLNGMMAQAQESHPTRLRALAVLPLAYPLDAIAVLDKAILEYGLHGVCLFSSTNGRPTVTSDLMPLFRRIDELDIPLFLHPPFISSVFAQSNTFAADRGLGWMYDTSHAAMSLVELGVLDECPNLRVVHPHVGGVLPYILQRVANGWRTEGEALADRRVEQIRTRMFTDSVTPTPGALTMASETYGPDHVLFATDYPWQPRGPMFKYLDTQVSPATRERILGNGIGWRPSLQASK
jgi:aminocarboxymuconate-semialdehyde decarboxylase